MADVLEVKRKHFSGLDADKAGITGVSGDTYAANDSGKDYYWNDNTSSWKRGLVERMIDHTWEGDNANNREIDLGDDYDYIRIFCEESFNRNEGHLTYANAFRTFYDVSLSVVATSDTGHYSMAAANIYYQGKMTGADANKIKLGSAGNNLQGTNFLNNTYRLIGFKFLDMD